MSDLITGSGRLQQQWNFGARWLERMVHYGPDIAEILSSVPDLHTGSLDEPFVGMRDVDPGVLQRVPLIRGDIRARIAPRASAALFVTPAGDGFGTPAAALTALFDLTAAEMRTLEHLLAGDTPAQAADKLGIRLTTLRTHQAHIFDKTGTSRVTDSSGWPQIFATRQPAMKPDTRKPPARPTAAGTLRNFVARLHRKRRSK